MVEQAKIDTSPVQESVTVSKEELATLIGELSSLRSEIKKLKEEQANKPTNVVRPVSIQELIARTQSQELSNDFDKKMEKCIDMILEYFKRTGI